jgi:ABC-type branched-subunit amino acid transport system substrate-binding protein
MANFYADTLKVKSVYVLDDSGAYGVVGISDTFQAQAQKRGISVLGRDQLNPREADYTTTLTKIKSLNPANRHAKSPPTRLRHPPRCSANLRGSISAIPDT